MLKIKLSDKKYRTFIDYAINSCDSFSLVFEKCENDTSQYTFMETYFSLCDNIIKKETIYLHPDTGTSFENADILYFEFNSQTGAFLKNADGIYNWNGKQLPEELCFYRNNKIWFSCTCHERLLRIGNETNEDIDFFKSHKIKYCYEI